MRMVIGGLCALLLAGAAHGQAVTSASSCEGLASLALPNAAITLARVVPAGTFVMPGTGLATAQFRQLPAFCRVVATLTPS